MLTIQYTEHFRIESPTIVTIGTFDGVHLGHQKILAKLKEFKKQTGYQTVVLTFDPHPRKVLFPEQKDLKLLTLVEEKLELLKKYDVDVTVVHPFTMSFADMEAQEYIERILIKQLNARYLIIGYDHRFGKNRSGDISTLRKYAPQYDLHIEEISPLDIDTIAISSTRIRKALEEGKIELATHYLGHNFLLCGKVIKGKQLGRTLGFPTANILPEEKEKLIPRMGVYFVKVSLGQENFFGMLNIGLNPTTDSDSGIKIEVHIFEFDLDIYNSVLRINFLKWLREEEKFANLSELKTALQRDKETCMQLIPVQS